VLLAIALGFDAPAPAGANAITWVIEASAVGGNRSAGDAGGMAARAYQLIVDGELSDRVALAFEGMTRTCEEGRTMLVGPVRDQAELQGLLQRVSDLGLTLLTVTVIDEPHKTGPR